MNLIGWRGNAAGTADMVAKPKKITQTTWSPIAMASTNRDWTLQPGTFEDLILLKEWQYQLAAPILICIHITHTQCTAAPPRHWGWNYNESNPLPQHATQDMNTNPNHTTSAPAVPPSWLLKQNRSRSPELIRHGNIPKFDRFCWYPVHSAAQHGLWLDAHRQALRILIIGGLQCMQKACSLT